MASNKSGIRGELPMLFPGCQVRNGWELDVDVAKEENKFTPTQVRILQFIRDRFDRGAVSVSYPAIREGLGIQKPNFFRALRDVKVHEELAWAGFKTVPARGPIPAEIERA